MVDGCDGTVIVVTAKVLTVPLPQLLFGVTVMSPLVEPAVTVMLLLPCPPVMLQPLGTVQVYATPDTLVTEYVKLVVF